MKIKKLSISVFAALVCNLHVFATDENSSKETAPTVPLENAKVLAPLEVNAFRFSDSILDLPLLAQSLGSEQITDSTLTTMPDILRKEANVYFRSANGTSSSGEVSMRGYGENSSSRVLVLLDGQRLNRFDMGALNWTQIAPENVENVEILKGAQSAVYGNNAVAGVIKITTKSPRDMADGYNASVGGSYGSYDEISAWARMSAKKDSVYVSANVNYFYDGGYRDNSISKSLGGGALVGYILNDANDISFRMNYSTEYMRFPGPLSYADFKNNPRASTDSPGDSDADYGIYSLEWKNKTAFGEGGIQTGLNTRDMYTRMWGFTDSFQWTYNFAPKYRLLLGSEDKSYVEGGVDLIYDSMDINNNGRKSEMDRITVGPWVGGKLTVNDSLSFIAAARVETAINSANSAGTYDDNDTQVGPAAQIGVNVKILESLSAYARFDQFYRYPSFDEIAPFYGPGIYNKDLSPENGQNYEIGLNYSDSYGFSGNFALFYSYTQNEIAVDPITWINSNLDPIERYGIDLSLAYESKYFGASTAWSFVNAEFASGINSGKKVPLVPSIIGTNQIWVKPVDYVKIALVYTWTDSQYLGNDNANTSQKLSSYGVFDIRAQVKIYDNVRIFAAVENIFDENYATYAYAGTPPWTTNQYYPSAGRTFRLGLEIRF